MNKFFLFLLSVCFCLNLSAGELQSYRKLQEKKYYRENYIEFQPWQAILTAEGIYVVHDKIYMPTIFGYDHDWECYYMPRNAKKVEYKSLEKYPELLKKIDQAMKSISHH